MNETHKHISKTEFVTSFFDTSMSAFYLYLRRKYLFIPLLVLCILILYGAQLCSVGTLSSCGFVKTSSTYFFPADML
jgi:hypothetical protein